MKKAKKSLPKKKKVLGRSIEAILGEDISGNGHVEIVPAGKLKPGRFQPRKEMKEDEIEELASSIRQYGILQPLLVRPLGEDGSYEIIAGERRWRAAQRGQRYEIPVYVLPLKEQDAYVAALTENLQREDLNAVEEALAFSKLIGDYDLTQEQLAGSIGKSRSYIANALRLLRLPEGILNDIRSGRLSAGHGRVLSASEEPESLAHYILSHDLSVREAEELLSKPKPAAKKVKKSSGQRQLTVEKLVPFLEKRCGVQASIKRQGNEGTLNIRYKDEQELRKLLSLFKK